MAEIGSDGLAEEFAGLTGLLHDARVVVHFVGKTLTQGFLKGRQTPDANAIDALPELRCGLDMFMSKPIY